MSILTSPSSVLSTSLIYITLGTLLDIWTIASLVFYPPETNWNKFLVVGFLVTGIALLAIGLFLGPIGRAARHAELPPTEVTNAVAHAEQIAAAHPPVVMPVKPVAQEGTPVEASTTEVVAPIVSQPGTPLGNSAPAGRK